MKKNYTKPAIDRRAIGCQTNLMTGSAQDYDVSDFDWSEEGYIGEN